LAANLSLRQLQQALSESEPAGITYCYIIATVTNEHGRLLQRGSGPNFDGGLQGWDFSSDPALYLIGYFEVETAGYAHDYTEEQRQALFAENYHVRHKSVFEDQKDKLVLVKGNPNSRLLKKAVLISDWGQDKRGRPLKVLSGEMQRIFGDFRGKISFQRSPTRWVDPAFVEKAATFVRSLP
jgi:hypothetical protein